MPNNSGFEDDTDIGQPFVPPVADDDPAPNGNARPNQINWLSQNEIVGGDRRHFAVGLGGFFAIGGKFSPRQFALPDGIYGFVVTREETPSNPREGFFYPAFPLARELDKEAVKVAIPTAFEAAAPADEEVRGPSLSLGLTLIAGPPGGGKTRLARAIATTATAEGRFVSWFDTGEPNVGSLDGNAATYSAIGQILLDMCYDHVDGSRVVPVDSAEWHESTFEPEFTTGESPKLVAAKWDRTPLVVIDSVSMLSLLGTAMARGGFAKSIFSTLRALDQAARLARVSVVATLNPLKVGERASEELAREEAMAYSSMCQAVLYIDGNSLTYTQRPGRHIVRLRPLGNDVASVVLDRSVSDLSRDRLIALLSR